MPWMWQRPSRQNQELEPNFPDGYRATTSQDSTPFVKASVEEVLKTLLEAIVLVVVVMYVFLQNWRAADHLPWRCLWC